MKNTATNNRRPRNRFAIFYKSHGDYIGPYGGRTFSMQQVRQMKVNGMLTDISNYILRSPLQLRRRVA
jgi:hypothetical protein